MILSYTETTSYFSSTNINTLVVHVRSETYEYILLTWDCKTTQLMIKTELLCCPSKQILERWVFQVGYGDNKTLLTIPNINSKVAFWDVCNRTRLVSSRQRPSNHLLNMNHSRQMNTHVIRNPKSLVSNLWRKKGLEEVESMNERPGAG